MTFVWLAAFKTDAYTNREIVYTWRKGLEASVDVPPESSSLLQYDLVGKSLFTQTYKITTGKDWHHETSPQKDARSPSSLYSLVHFVFV